MCVVLHTGIQQRVRTDLFLRQQPNTPDHRQGQRRYTGQGSADVQSDQIY